MLYTAYLVILTKYAHLNELFFQTAYKWNNKLLTFKQINVDKMVYVSFTNLEMTQIYSVLGHPPSFALKLSYGNLQDCWVMTLGPPS